MSLSSRFPTLQDNLRAYAIIVTFVYAWTILWWFWALPSWLYFLTLTEIVSMFAYALTTNLLESVLILFGLNLLSLLLPDKWFRNSFVAQSFWLVALGLGYLMYFASLFRKEDEAFPAEMLQWSPLIFAAIFVVSLLLDRVGWVRRLAERIADQLTIFLYLTIPLSVIALLVVLIRNAW